MKLIDLQEDLGPKEISLSDKTAQKQPQMPKTQGIGNPGAEAMTFKHKTHAGSVTKVIRNIENPEESAQVVFTQIAMANEGNPFFPRFYKAKMIPHGKYGLMTLFVEMEKLQPITGYKIREMIPHILEQLGVPPKKLEKLIKSGIGDEDYNTKDWMTDKKSMNVYNAFSQVMNNWSTLEEMAKHSTNPQFGQAVKALRPWTKQFNLDLHEGNWMFRLTSVGPQLVILDPFYKVKQVGNAWMI